MQIEPMYPCKPESYYLFRSVEVRQAANGYVVVCRLPCHHYDENGDRAEGRVWGKSQLIFTSRSELMEWMDEYFGCSQSEMDAMGDRYYRHDMAKEMTGE